MSVSARRRLLGAVAGTALAAGAGAARALMAGDPPDSPNARLDPNLANSPWSGAASLTGTGGVYSAMLITPRFALTALHVVPPEPPPLRVNLNIDADISHRIEVARTHRHPQFKAMTVDHGAHDLCLLELAAPAPPSARVHPIATVPPARGEEITLVGYGASGAGSRGVTVPAVAALKRTGGNRIDEILALGTPPVPTVYLFTFDGPGASLGNTRETGLASGDSGSAAFVKRAGSWQLAGINTFVLRGRGAIGAPFTYGTRGGGQILASQVGWLRSVIGVELDRRLVR